MGFVCIGLLCIGLVVLVDAEMISLEFSLMLMFVMAIFLMFFIIRRNDKEVKTLKDLFKPRKTKLSYKERQELLKKISAEISELNAIEALMVMRTLMGSSFKAQISVNSQGISIEGIGIYVDIVDEQKEDITG